MDELASLRARTAELEAELDKYREADRAPREREKDLVNLQRLARVGTWVWDLVTGEVEWSDEVYRIFDLDPKDFHPRIDSVVSRVHEEDRKRLDELLEQAVEEKEPFTFEAKIRLPDGSDRYVLSISEAHYGDAGTPTRVSGIVQDITERTRAEQALRESEERFQEIAANIREVFWLFDYQERKTIYVSPAYEQVFGRSLRDIYENHLEWADSIHPDDAAYALDTWKEIVKKEGGRRREYRIVRPDGAVRWIADRGIAIRDADGRVLRMTGVAEDVTERKIAEQSLRESEEKFRNITEQSLMAIVILQDDQVKYANEAASRTLGYDIEEMLSWTTKDWLRFVHPDDLPFVVEQAIKQQAGEEDLVTNHEWRIVTKTGETRWIEGHATTILYEGRTAGLTAAVDITERKRTEEALRDSERILSDLIEFLPDPTGAIDSEGRVIVWNRAMAEMLDVPAEEMVGKGDYEYALSSFGERRPTLVDMVFRPDEKIREYYPNFVRDGDKISNENYLPNFKGGTYLWAKAAPLYNANGEVIGAIQTVRDTTSQRHSEIRLRESEERLRMIFETAQEGIFLKDRNLRYTLVNESMSKLFRLPAGEFEGKTDEELFGKEVGALSGETDTRVLSGDVIEKEEIRSSEEGPKTLHVVKVPMRDPEGNVSGLFGTIRDLTDRKLLETQFREAQKMEAVGTLAGGIAHDFNNQLQAVQGYAELLLLRERTEGTRYTQIQEILKAVNRSRDLVQQLLTFSRRADSTREPVDLNTTVEDVRRLLARTIPKMIEIDVRLEPALHTVDAHPGQMEQLLMNLGVNARDAMPGGGKLSFETRNVNLDEEDCRKQLHAAPGDYVLLTVSDTGEGMDEKTLNRIFEPFYTTKEVGKGSGLGLAMVYGIVRSHGGHILCYSEPGRGTAFRIYLPAFRGAGAPTRTGPAAEFAIGAGETILVVDDEEMIRDLAKEVLEKFGYQVVTVKDGETALDLYRREGDRVDLIILDLIMPGMGGTRCLEELQEIDPDVKVLLASGFVSDSQGGESLASGAKGIISKPYEIKMMLELIREVLEKG